MTTQPSEPSAAEALSDEERATLLRPCACGHTINDHGSLANCWTCGDEGGECDSNFEDLLTARVATIVADHDSTRDRELGERIAAAIEATFADPERVRPLKVGAEFATDLATDVEWCAQIARAESERARQHTGTGGE